MSTDQLHRALQDATAHLVPADDIVARARHGGQRRQRRRRATTGGITAAVLVFALLATVAGYRAATHPDRVDAAAKSVSGLLDRPARGNLAHDEAAVAAAQRGYSGETHGLAQGHVIWIGRTRYGDAAIVGHRVAGTGRDKSTVRQVAVSLLTRTGAGAFKAADAVVLDPGTRGLAEPAFGNRLMIAIDVGAPAYYSTRHSFGPKATSRIWHRVHFSGGAAVLPVARGDTMLVAASTHPTANQIVGSPTPMTPPTVRDNTLDWGARPEPLGNAPAPTAIPATANAAQLDWARRGGAAKLFQKEFNASRYADPLQPWPAVSTLTPWVVYGQTSTQRFVLGEVQYDSEPSHVYVVVNGTTVHYVGVASRKAVLPVKWKLPDAWVVAAKGKTLAYRTGSGSWHDAGHDAAVLPIGATEVRVGGTPVTL
ncbi:hypothetical protein Athai_38480 [Actinocatenispora thailandica]|uniref:Uncharacterized protein n=1 Tax=Actinocatenispora thailandica TaxID=227318 RepID=A0A7R7DR31_9ACTN|nr:hypothetical protein [Actinocatenispora thailandica]BCJ36345.1 hypothetical protein Athai_38480 [Actinocatenispora thailandica]